MSDKINELKAQESEIRTKLAYVFIPIAVVIIVVVIYQNNSLDYQFERYMKEKETEFNGIVKNKKEDGDYPRAPRYLILDPFRKIQVPNNIYYEVNVGDSVFKKSGEDSVYYHLKNGRILVEDRIRFFREKYLELKKNK